MQTTLRSEQECILMLGCQQLNHRAEIPCHKGLRRHITLPLYILSLFSLHHTNLFSRYVLDCVFLVSYRMQDIRVGKHDLCLH